VYIHTYIEKERKTERDTNRWVSAHVIVRLPSWESSGQAGRLKILAGMNVAVWRPDSFLFGGCGGPQAFKAFN